VIRFSLALAVVCAACTGFVDARAPWESKLSHDVGRPVLGFRWKKVVIDHSDGYRPQELARVTLGAAPEAEKRVLFLGSHGGDFLALRAHDGKQLWAKHIGPTSGESLLSADGNTIYVGTDEGYMYALSTVNGGERWHYNTKGAILRPPIAVGDMLVFATDADRVIALDRDSGKWRWQYARETPEEFTLHGHAGVSAGADKVYAGFADGHVVALSSSGGEILWVRSLSGDSKQFVDVDTTPLLHDGAVYAASAAGGLYALDANDGTERWHLPATGATQLTLAGDRLYAAAADSGLYALDLGGHLLWRQGFAKAGDPARPLVDGSYLFLSISEKGLYVIDKQTGRLLQSFNPGPGVSAAATVAGDDLYFMSNGGVLYAMDVSRY
jgi:outer membrane protein assembly factor BamB